MKYTITYKTKQLNKPVELDVEGSEGVKHFLKKTIHFFTDLEWFKINKEKTLQCGMCFGETNDN